MNTAISPSKQLREFRKKSGLSPDQIATAIGMPRAAYYDLEGTGDLNDNISLGDLAKLASVLGIRSADLFSAQPLANRIRPQELASLLGQVIEARGIGLRQLEDQVGWALGPVLQNPETGILSWNMTCLRDVCRELGCSWVAVLDGIGAGDPK